MLINKNAVHHAALKEEYPIVVHSPNLNGSKLPTYRLSSTNPLSDDELDTAIRFFGTKAGIQEMDLTKLRNICRFFTGDNLRRIEQLFQSKNIQEFAAATAPPKMWDSKALRQLEKEPLIHSLLDSLYAKNAHFFKKLEASDLSLEAIGSCSWQDLIPLNRDEILSCVRQDKTQVEDVVFLSDRDWFNISQSLDELRPCAPMHLYAHHQRQKYSSYADFLKKLPVELSLNVFGVQVKPKRL